MPGRAALAQNLLACISSDLANAIASREISTGTIPRIPSGSGVQRMCMIASCVYFSTLPL